ncbi:DUF975 family protein [Aquirufa sp. ROCK2-A2]
MTNSQITLASREKLSGNWLPAILSFLIIAILLNLHYLSSETLSTPITLPSFFPYSDTINVSSKLSFNYANIVTFILGGALSFGGAVFSLFLVRGEKTDIELIFSGFKDLNRFFVFLASNILILIFTIAWTLLLIIPGIIAALSYSMTYYILVDNPEMSSLEAINQSKLMMKGHKWQLFKLWLRFIGLGCLCVLTIGIGFLWLIPYANICSAQFYDSLLED